MAAMPLLECFIRGDVDPEVAMLAAQGALAPRADEQLAILVYRTLKDGFVYADPGADAYDTQHRTHVVRRLRQRAQNLGFGLINLSTGEVLDGAVS